MPKDTTTIYHDEPQSETRLDAIESRLTCQGEKIDKFNNSRYLTFDDLARFEGEMLQKFNTINNELSLIRTNIKGLGEDIVRSDKNLSGLHLKNFEKIAKIDEQASITAATLKGFIAGYTERLKK